MHSDSDNVKLNFRTYFVLGCLLLIFQLAFLVTVISLRLQVYYIDRVYEWAQDDQNTWDSIGDLFSCSHEDMCDISCVGLRSWVDKCFFVF